MTKTKKRVFEISMKKAASKGVFREYSHQGRLVYDPKNDHRPKDPADVYGF